MQLYQYGRGIVCDEKVVCTRCGSEPEKMFFQISSWTKKSHQVNNFCEKCVRKMKYTGLVDVARPVFIVREVPMGSIPIFERPPVLTQRNDDTVWSAAYSREKTGCKINDQTRCVGRPGYTLSPDVQIGQDVTELLEKKDNTAINPTKYLQEIKKSKLEVKKIKMLK